jgi:hypothetical protein
MAILIPALCLCAVVVFFLPPVHDRLAWRIDEAVLRLRYTLNPPARQVFLPQEGQITPSAQAMELPTATFTPSAPTSTATEPGPTSTPAPSPTPTERSRL